MLSYSTTLSFARLLVDFANESLAASELAAALRHSESLFPFHRRSTEHNEQLRVRAQKTLQWLAQRAFIDDALRRGIGAEWLYGEFGETETPEMAFTPLSVELDYERGQLVLRSVRVKSLDAFVALTIAELLAEDAPARVRQCALSTCSALFLQETGVRGRPREHCSTAHANTDRTHRFRAKAKKRRTRR